MATNNALLWLSVIIAMLVIFPEAYGKKKTKGKCSTIRRDYLNINGYLLDEHNFFRCLMKRKNENVKHFQWEKSLEISAKARAKKCTEHDKSDKNHIQQLVVVNSRFINPVLEMYKKYKNRKRGRTENEIVLQMVWEQSTNIGCASVNCNESIYHVCHYGSNYSESPEKRIATPSVVTKGRNVATTCEDKYGGFPKNHDYSKNGRYIDEHNYGRCKIRRSKIPRLRKSVKDFQWDDSLEAKAKIRARRCRKNYPMNIGHYVVWTSHTYSSPVKAIFENYEKSTREKMEYSTSQTPPFIQILWEQSTKLGCGSHNCREMIYYICLYEQSNSESPEKRITTPSVVTKGRNVATICEDKYGGFPKNHDYSKQGRFLNEHNYVRCLARTGKIPRLPKGPYVQDLQWDASLENSATRSARKCYNNHGQGISYGENIAWSSNKFDSPTEAWYYEYEQYRYGLVEHTAVTELHLTQMLWENTTKVGCGSHRCHFGMLYFCHYKPRGNMLREYPYRRN